MNCPEVKGQGLAKRGQRTNTQNSLSAATLPRSFGSPKLTVTTASQGKLASVSKKGGVLNKLLRPTLQASVFFSCFSNRASDDKRGGKCDGYRPEGTGKPLGAPPNPQQGHHPDYYGGAEGKRRRAKFR